MKNKKKIENNIVAQCNHLLDAPKTLTLREYKLFLFLVSGIDSLKDKKLAPIVVSVEDFSYFLGIEKNKNMFDELRKTTKLLKSRVVELWDERKEVLSQIGFVGTIKYDRPSGTVTIPIDKDMYPYLLELKKNFTQFKFQNIINLSSMHGVRLYELLKMYEYTGEASFELEDLRKKLGIKGGELVNFADFNRRVLQISEREINGKTDLRLSYEAIKKGKKIVSVIFKLKRLKERKHVSEKKEKIGTINITKEVKKATESIKANRKPSVKPITEVEKSTKNQTIVDIADPKQKTGIIKLMTNLFNRKKVA